MTYHITSCCRESCVAVASNVGDVKLVRVQQEVSPTSVHGTSVFSFDSGCDSDRDSGCVNVPCTAAKIGGAVSLALTSVESSPEVPVSVCRYFCYWLWGLSGLVYSVVPMAKEHADHLVELTGNALLFQVAGQVCLGHRSSPVARDSGCDSSRDSDRDSSFYSGRDDVPCVVERVGILVP